MLNVTSSGNMNSFNGPESALLHVMINGNMWSFNSPESALLHVRISGYMILVCGTNIML